MRLPNGNHEIESGVRKGRGQGERRICEEEEVEVRKGRGDAVEALKEAGLVDAKGQLKEDTTLIFTTLPDQELAVEAIQPGILRDRKGVWLGHYKSPRLTRAIFDLHLGPCPLNGLSKAMVGNDTLYAANGFTTVLAQFRGEMARERILLPYAMIWEQGGGSSTAGRAFDAQTAVPNMYLASKDGVNWGDAFTAEEMLPTVEAFHFYNPERTPHAGHLLLSNISRLLKATAQRGQPKKRFPFF